MIQPRYTNTETSTHKVPMKKIYLPIVFSFCLIGCGTIQTGNDALDAAYNVSSALIEGKDQSKKCEQRYQRVREACLKANKKIVDVLNASLANAKRK